jgi:nucleotide-binding universal stress UspA family protein
VKRIVAGTDGSAGAANALRWAARLAARHGAEVVVMTGFVPTDAELPPRRVAALLAEREAELAVWSKAARLGEVAVRTVVERGDPRPGLLAVAEREHADLVVVGRVGRSAGPGLLHFGSVAEWLAHHSDLPVAVVGGVVNLVTRSVLVGVDGSDGAAAAVRWVREMRGDAELRVIAAAVEQPYLEWTPADSSENWRRVLEAKIHDEYAADLVDAGVELDVLALAGSNVADLLLEGAKDERVDLVVVGTRGLGGFSGLRVGGVALKVLHRADRPVVFVPSP